MSASEKYMLLNNEKIPAVHNAGKEVGKSEFWTDIVVNRTNWQYAFSQWDIEHFIPPIKVIPTKQNLAHMFSACAKLKYIGSDYLDLSQVPTAPSGGNNNGLYWTFYNCTSLEVIEDIGLGAINKIRILENTFYGCSKLRTIEKLTLDKDTQYTNPFMLCSSLENITIKGIIGQNGLSFSSCKKLTHDSLMSIINALADYRGQTGWSVTLGDENLAKLTEVEKNTATDKGWGLN